MCKGHDSDSLSVVIEFCASGVMMELFRELVPDASDWPEYDNFHWVKLWLGFYLNNAILPVNILITYIKPTVQWGRSVYAKHQGRVHVLRRVNP